MKTDLSETNVDRNWPKFVLEVQLPSPVEWVSALRHHPSFGEGIQEMFNSEKQRQQTKVPVTIAI